MWIEFDYVFVFLVVGRGGISRSGVGVSLVNRYGVSGPVVGIAYVHRLRLIGSPGAARPSRKICDVKRVIGSSRAGYPGQPDRQSIASAVRAGTGSQVLCLMCVSPLDRKTRNRPTNRFNVSYLSKIFITSFYGP